MTWTLGMAMDAMERLMGEQKAEIERLRAEAPHPESICGQLVKATARIERLEAALNKSVTLQSHYASLLNEYDGGSRRQFLDGEDWMERLRACELVARAALAGKEG